MIKTIPTVCKYIFIFIICFFNGELLAQPESSLGNNAGQVGEFETSADIGNPKIKGSSQYDLKSQTYTLSGAGYNIWFNHDEFRYVYKKIKGDFLLTANFQLIGNEKGTAHRKTGWMIRESAEDNSVCVLSCLHGDGTGRVTMRILRGAYMRDPEEMIFFPKQYFGEKILQLERIGKKITMRIAHPGEPFEEMGSSTLPDLKDEVLVGLYVLSHDPEVLQEAKIWNVRITTPVAPDWIPNIKIKPPSNESLKVGSRLETVDITSGKRKIWYESSTGFKSPYFSPKGDKIYFEQDSKTYEISLSGGIPIEKTKVNPPKEINSDSKYIYCNEGDISTYQIWRKKKDGTEAMQMTHDLEHAWYPHVSPDGKWLAYIAFPHDANPKAPMLFQNVRLNILPLSGGAPKSIAYFFGGKGSFENYAWSPDSQSLVFMSNSVQE